MGEINTDNPCGEIALSAPQPCVLKHGIDPATLPWPCFIEHGSPIGEVWSLSQEVQKRADAEDMPVRWVFNDCELIAYPGNSHQVLIDQWDVETKRRETRKINARFGITTHQTAVTYVGGQRGGKTEAMRLHILKARKAKKGEKALTLMDILAKDNHDHE